MLEIKPNWDKKTILQYCHKLGKLINEAHYLYTAMDGDELLAACLFEISGNQASALYYEGSDPGDYFLFDGLLRAGLNYAAEQGIENGFIPEEFRQRHSHMFSKLKYPPEAEMNIVNFFRKYKYCAGGY